MRCDMNTTFGKNLRAFIEHKNIYQQDVADKVGVTLTTLNGWLNRGVQPRAKIVDELKSAYNLTDDDLFSESNGYYAKLHGLAPKRPEGALSFADTPRVTMPVVGKIHAGTPTAPEYVLKEIDVPAWVRDEHPHGYILQAEGDCMNKVFNEGCYLGVDPDMPPVSGKVAAVSVDGEPIIRRLYIGANSIVLSPESYNPVHKDIIITDPEEHEVVMEGTVFFYMSDRDRF